MRGIEKTRKPSKLLNKNMFSGFPSDKLIPSDDQFV